MLHCIKKLDYVCNCKSEISNGCNEVKAHCLQAMKIVHHNTSGHFCWLISEHQSVNPSREPMSVPPGKYKSFMLTNRIDMKLNRNTRQKDMVL